MLTGFKEFLFRGNLIDLAVAVVIGTAFVGLVTAFTTYVINPMIASVGGGSFGLGFTIEAGNRETFVDIGSFLTACLAFAITAAVVYFAVVVPMRRVTTRFAASTEPPAVPADVQLLTEIRDSLARRDSPSDG